MRLDVMPEMERKECILHSEIRCFPHVELLASRRHNIATSQKAKSCPSSGSSGLQSMIALRVKR